MRAQRAEWGRRRNKMAQRAEWGRRRKKMAQRVKRSIVRIL